jgi:FixJ family two-component response regulator
MGLKKGSILIIDDNKNVLTALPVVLFTAYTDIDLAVRALKQRLEMLYCI